MGSPSTSRIEHCGKRWERRIQRARELRDIYPAAAAPLRFYGVFLDFQRAMAEESRAAIDAALPLRQQIDLSLASSKMPRLLSLAFKHGADVVRLQAEELLKGGASSWDNILQTALLLNGPLSAFDDIIARACLQPVAENLQCQLATDSNYSQNVCPACGGLPQLAILRPEGEGASRRLLCSFCLREWSFRRIICPYCGEEDKEKLSRYSSEEYSQVHVEACDTCKRYLKAVDLTRDGHAVPLVDEAAVAVLDVWAVEHGYSKIVRNLVGF